VFNNARKSDVSAQVLRKQQRLRNGCIGVRGKEREMERKVRIGKCGSEADAALGGMTPRTCVRVIW
jgi:hypothetical protein